MCEKTPTCCCMFHGNSTSASAVLIVHSGFSLSNETTKKHSVDLLLNTCWIKSKCSSWFCNMGCSDAGLFIFKVIKQLSSRRTSDELQSRHCWTLCKIWYHFFLFSFLIVCAYLVSSLPRCANAVCYHLGNCQVPLWRWGVGSVLILSWSFVRVVSVFLWHDGFGSGCCIDILGICSCCSLNLRVIMFCISLSLHFSKINKHKLWWGSIPACLNVCLFEKMYQLNGYHQIHHESDHFKTFTSGGSLCGQHNQLHFLILKVMWQKSVYSVPCGYWEVKLCFVPTT